MKKFLAVTFATTLVLGLAGVASAVHIERPADVSATSDVVAKGGLITLDGSVRSRGWAKITATGGSSNTGDAVARGNDIRTRLGATANLGNGGSGRLHLETGSGNGDTEAWGQGGSGLHLGGWKHDPLELLEAWGAWAPGKTGVKIGHMPLALGNKLFFDHTGSGDDAVVLFHNPNANTHLAALWIKFVESGSADDSTDIDGYVALVTSSINEGMKVGANWTTLTNKGTDMRFHNLGLTLDGSAGAIGYKLDFEKNLGQINSSLDASGWAAQGEVSMGMGDVTLGALVGYGTGDDDAGADSDNEAFLNFLTDTRYQVTNVGYINAVPNTGGGLGAYAGKNTGLSNLQVYQVNAKTNTKCPLTGKDLALKGRLSYMKLSEAAATHDDSVGTDIELFATWKLTNGISFGVEATYLVAGDAWKGAGAATEVDNPWFTRATWNMAF